MACLSRPRRRLCHAPFIDGRECRMHDGWVYIMTNQPNGTLYVAVTTDLVSHV
jgi:hypothetical protein